MTSTNTASGGRLDFRPLLRDRVRIFVVPPFFIGFFSASFQERVREWFAAGQPSSRTRPALRETRDVTQRCQYRHWWPCQEVSAGDAGAGAC